MHTGYKVAFMTQTLSSIVERRARDLGVPHLFLGTSNKRQSLVKLQQELQIDERNTLFMGDDIQDFAAFEVAGGNRGQTTF